MYRAYGLGRRPRPPTSRDPPPTSNRGLSTQTRLNICRFLLLGWSRQLIANHEGCSIHAVTNVEHNLLDCGSVRKVPTGILGRPSKIGVEDGEALFEHLVRSGWLYQDEIVYWLFMERGINCSQSTVSRYLKQQNWTRASIRPFSINRNEDLREAYRNSLRRFAADDLVFLDESIFNEKCGWRHKAYGPIGDRSRYTQDIKRGDTYAILPAYTINGYLPCTGIKKGYFNHDDFVEWITERLLPTLQSHYGNKPMVVILDNVSIHTNTAIAQIIEGAGHIVRYLPPYSPDYNPIELTFGVLKAYIKRNFVWTRGNFESFGLFLQNAIHSSRCDRFATKHFKFAAGGLYIQQADLDEARRQVRAQE